MSVLDRVRRIETTGDPTSPDKSSTQLAAVEPPVVRRLRVVMNRLAAYAATGPKNKYSRYAWVMQSMVDEVLDEIAADADPDTIASWFGQFGRIIEWCGSGDDSILPDSVRKYLAETQPDMLAITAGAVD